MKTKEERYEEIGRPMRVCYIKAEHFSLIQLEEQYWEEDNDV